MTKYFYASEVKAATISFFWVGCILLEWIALLLCGKNLFSLKAYDLLWGVMYRYRPRWYTQIDFVVCYAVSDFERKNEIVELLSNLNFILLRGVTSCNNSTIIKPTLKMVYYLPIVCIDGLSWRHYICEISGHPCMRSFLQHWVIISLANSITRKI